MISFITIDDKRKFVVIEVTQNLEDFLNKEFRFIKRPAGWLNAKRINVGDDRRIVVSIYYPDHFVVGGKTMLQYQQHETPNGHLEHRFMFSPLCESVNETVSRDEMCDAILTGLNIPSTCGYTAEISSLFGIIAEEKEAVRRERRRKKDDDDVQ